MTSFRLKDATNITIDNNEVERIKILNDIVWEKIRETELTLEVQPMFVVMGQDFTLRAYVIDKRKNQTIDGEVLFSGKGISGSQKVTIKNGVAELKVKGENIEFEDKVTKYQYTATFQKTEKYLASSSTIDVEFKKDTPKITIVGLKNGKNTLYYRWKIGCKLESINGSAIKNKQVHITINGPTYNPTTNEKGIASLNIRLDNPGTYEATFKVDGDAMYNEVEKTYTYNYVKYIDTKIPILSYTTTGDGKKWTKNNTNEFQCGTVSYPCDGIQVNQKPQLLKITFDKSSITSTSFYQIKLTFDSYSMKNQCYGLNMGGWFTDSPVLQLDRLGGVFEEGKTGEAFSSEKNINSWYSSLSRLSQKIEWSYKEGNSQYNEPFSITTNPTISIQYGKNQGNQEGAIKINNIYLTISEMPSQDFNWSS